MNTALFVGIDPGLNGAIAVINQDRQVVALTNVPTFKIKGKQYYDIGKMVAIVRQHSILRPIYCYSEQVGARPGQGVTSMFRFGYGVGLWEGIVHACCIPHCRVTPQKWKKAMLPGAKEKEEALVRAKELYPELEELDTGDKEKRIGKADALLIALYAHEAELTEIDDVRVPKVNGRRTRKNAAKGVQS